MKMRGRILISLCFIILTLFACDKILSTPINKIFQNPRDYVDKQVTVSGTVVDIFNMVVIKYFVIQDKTGEITVVTDRPLPAKGQKIKVKGTVKDEFSIGNQQLIVLVENAE